MSEQAPGNLLQVRKLVVSYQDHQSRQRAVDQLDLDLAAGQMLALVGESGCGKSSVALALMGLVPAPAGQVESGRMHIDGQEYDLANPAATRELRGRELAMVFQEPMTALNPVRSIGSQMREVLARNHARRGEGRLGRTEARRLAAEWLERVHIPRATDCLGRYPHELSGGMRQRVMIAMALSCRPRLLIADEPTTALDVTTQAQILDEIQSLQKETGTAVLLITHDLGVVAETCQRAMVMYAGRVVEEAPVETLFASPRHPYTAGLLASVPRIRQRPLERLPTIPGQVGSASRVDGGCRFQPRCPYAKPVCSAIDPELHGQPGERRHACHYPLPGNVNAAQEQWR